LQNSRLGRSSGKYEMRHLPPSNNKPCSSERSQGSFSLVLLRKRYHVSLLFKTLEEMHRLLVGS
jgi:hypothetical protein